MPKEKFELSQTLKFLVSRVQALTGAGEVELELESETLEVAPGGVLRAQARLRNPGRPRGIAYVVIGMRGQVHGGGQWQDYTESAEIAQQTQLGGDQELVIPVEIHIPQDAVTSADGGEWSLDARAVMENAVDPRGSHSFAVVEAMEEE